jgi:hypothetical protein
MSAFVIGVVIPPPTVQSEKDKIVDIYGSKFLSQSVVIFAQTCFPLLES